MNTKYQSPKSGSAIALYIVGVKWPPETFIARKITALIDAGVIVTVCSRSPAILSFDLKQPGLRLVYLPRLSLEWRSILTFIALLTRKLILAPLQTLFLLMRAMHEPRAKKILRFVQLLPFIHENPDIIHFEWNFTAVDYLPLFDLINCPIVISCRGSQISVAPYNPDTHEKAKRLELTFQKAQAIHCVSQAIFDEAVTYGLTPEKAWIIRPAVDPYLFTPAKALQRADDRFRIITTGSLIWRKGYEYALMAIRLLVDQGVHLNFEIIGDGPERQRVMYTIEDLQLSGVVQMCGRLTPGQVRDRLQASDVFVLSSLSEGISNAVLEAMACGVPVVTTDCGGMREAVTDGVEGFVVPVRDPEALAHALHELARDLELGTKMGKAARERVLREFALEQQAAAFLQLYRTAVVRENRRPPAL